jgi:large subunit ribosomal protein L17
MAYLHDKEIVTKLFSDLSERFKGRKGGYTRSIKANVRNGDCAPMTLIELVGGESDKTAEKTGKPKKAAPKKEKAKAAPKKEKAKATAPKKAKAAPASKKVKAVAKKDGTKAAPKKPVNKEK